MTLKEYQQDVVDEFVRWYSLLKDEKERAAKVSGSLAKYQDLDEESMKVLRDNAVCNLAVVWGQFHGSAGSEWRTRTTPSGDPIPHVCIKVPTGGGKTRIAAAILHGIGKGRGLVLWMVPSDAIMQQTRAILGDKTHWVRQTLDIASGNRTKILKKDTRFSREDLRDNLCVMPIMQQAANRIDAEFLRITRSNGAYSEFFPDTDETKKLDEFKRDHPGLDMVNGTNIPRSSLVNVFRMIRPIIILDEAHKASAKNFGKWAEFVNKLGPGLVIELSATPNEDESNIIKSVTGRELRDEQMIKNNIVVALSRQNWQGVLQKAVRELKNLERDAIRDVKRYLRPIMVIRVARTDPDLHGKDTGYVHAFDARNHLVSNLSIPSEQVAIKSSAMDDLRGQDLMDRESPIRYIITQNALMEGWDCPSAYILTILDNLKSQRALTQLLGRIMRQPYTEYADTESLNDCYVYCIHDDSERVIRMIRQQLDEEGLTGIGGHVVLKNGEPKKRTNTRRAAFRKLEIHLPKVSHRVGGDRWGDIDYEKHILSEISWDDVWARYDGAPADSVRRRGDTVKIDTVTGGYEYVTPPAGAGGDSPKLAEWVLLISELVPNAWQAARMVREFWESTGMSDGAIVQNTESLRDMLLEKVRRRVVDAAESVFRRKLMDGTIRFDMHAGSTTYRMRGEYETMPAEGKILQRRSGLPVQLSLDEPIYEEDFDSKPERRFASYLDEARAIEWWHRVVARNEGEYYLRGWQKNKIYPDFITVFGEADGRVFRIYEIKGRHLENPDTEYKAKVLKLLGETLTAGNLRVTDGLIKGDFKIVFDDQIDDSAVTGLNEGENSKAAHLKPIGPGGSRKKKK